MKKLRSFLGFFVYLFVVFVSANALADGYTCPESKKYTECSSGYYMAYNGDYNGTPTTGNTCDVCPTGCTCAGGTDAPVCSVTVTLNLNGGTGTPQTTAHCTGTTCTCPNGAACTLPAYDSANPLTKDGSIFSGWSTASDDTIPGVQSMTFTEATTLYAVWIKCEPCIKGPGVETCHNGVQNNMCITGATCKIGYGDKELNGATYTCSPLPYTITYASNDGTNATQTQNVIYDTLYTTKSASTFTRTGYKISNWVESPGGGKLSPNQEYVYQYPADTTYNAEWTACSELSDGACNCPAGTYPQNGMCIGCVKSCQIEHGDAFPIGYYDICKSEGPEHICHRECTTDDIPHSASVSGNVYAGNDPTAVCSVVTCENGYTPSGNTCVAKTFTVTFNNDGGTGGPASITVTYDQMPQKLTATPTKTNYSFVGYFKDSKQYFDVNGNALQKWDIAANTELVAHWTQNKVQCVAGKMYNGTSMVDCESGKVCPGTGETMEGVAGCFLSCPDGYNASDIGSTSSDNCYILSQKPCTDPGANKDCPSYSNFCYHLTETKVDCKRYYGSSTCIAIGDDICPVDPSSVDCRANRYNDNGVCSLCSEIPGSNGNWPLSVGGVGNTEVCYKNCDFDCTEYVNEHLTPEHATCQPLSPKINGGKYYPSTECQPLIGRSCTATACVCEAGYDFIMPTGADGDIGSCAPKTLTITLNANGGNGGSTVYEKYTIGWFGDATAKTSITKVTPPSRADWTFIGYYTSAEGGDQVIGSNGDLPANDKFTTDTTLYAHWEQDFFTCAAGKTADGATCPAGSYCPGDNVSVSEKYSTTTGCARTCPADTNGGIATSDAGADGITKCYSTKSNVELSDNTGMADSTCFYSDSAKKYQDRCTIKITSCIAGHYREKENSITCAIVGNGAYSPAGNLNKYMCKDLNGANENTTTKSTESGSPDKCYNVCEVKSIDNGALKPVNAEEYYNMTQIPACSYTTTCNTGYSVNGNECIPNVYKISLDHNTGSSDISAIYLKYNTGWYSDKDATTPISRINIPTKPGSSFFGYIADSTIVVDSEGTLITNYKVFSENSTIVASWEQKASITCEPGTYYSGTGDKCTECPAGSYCGGTTSIQDIEKESGIMTCESLNGTYTTAPGRTTIISSDAKSKSETACYATNVVYTSVTNHGSGAQTCHYNPATKVYNTDCFDHEIFTCVAGYYLENDSDIDCSEVGIGHYSPENVLNRYECPNYDENIGVTTFSTTSAAVTQCYLGNIWYEPVGGHSGHRRSCYHVADANITDVNLGYSHNCVKPSVIVTCDAGYYDDGAYTNSNGERDCRPVGDGFYSPAQTFFATRGEELQPETEGGSTLRYACPENGKTGTDTAAFANACYIQCKAINIDNGTTQPVSTTVKYPGEFIADGETPQNYPACSYTASCDAGFTFAGGTTENPQCTKCAEGKYCPTGGTPQDCPDNYPYSEAGSTSMNQCYRECKSADIDGADTVTGTLSYGGANQCVATSCLDNAYLDGKTCKACPAAYPNANAGATDADACYRQCEIADVPMSDVVTGTITSGGVNNCAATSCKPGSYLSDGECITCPAGKTCTGGTDAPQSCPESHPYSAAGSNNEAACYQKCETHAIEGGTAIANEPSANYPKVCTFTGKSDSGNPCEIVNEVCIETSCNSDFELIGGRCRPCDRDNALGYLDNGNCLIASCITGFHPTPDGKECAENVRECKLSADTHAVRAEQTWNFTQRVFDKCIILECEDGYHLASNACVLDEQACTVENGVGIHEWNHATNTWGECIATKCDPGYTNDKALTNERSKQCGQCKNKFSVLGEVAVSSYIPGVDCEIASCLYQGELYNLDNNECVPICDINGYSDETGTMKWDPSRKKCVRTCKEGYISW